jgi:hypothetical protein
MILFSWEVIFPEIDTRILAQIFDRFCTKNKNHRAGVRKTAGKSRVE